MIAVRTPIKTPVNTHTHAVSYQIGQGSLPLMAVLLPVGPPVAIYPGLI